MNCWDESDLLAVQDADTLLIWRSQSWLQLILRLRLVAAGLWTQRSTDQRSITAVQFLLPCGFICWLFIGSSCHSDCLWPPAGGTTCSLARHKAAKPPSDQTTLIGSEFKSNNQRRLRLSRCCSYCVSSSSSSILSEWVREWMNEWVRWCSERDTAVEFRFDRTQSQQIAKIKKVK